MPCSFVDVVENCNFHSKSLTSSVDLVTKQRARVSACFIVRSVITIYNYVGS